MIDELEEAARFFEEVMPAPTPRLDYVDLFAGPG